MLIMATSKPMVPNLLSESLHSEGDGGDQQSVASAVEDSQKRGKKNKRDKASLIKAPQAPKRFKSSYICFFMSQQPIIKQELGEHASVSEVSKRSAELWRHLPAEQRVHWDEVATKDKHRYLIEKSQYTGPWQVQKKKTKKDPSAPKRPMSAFLFFSQGRRQVIKDQNPDIMNTEVSRILGEQWRNATDEEKKPFIEKEKEEREIYKVAMATWRDENEQKKEEERRLLETQIAQQYSQQATSYASQGTGNQSIYNSSVTYNNGSAYGARPSSPTQSNYAQDHHSVATAQPQFYGAQGNDYGAGPSPDGHTPFPAGGKGPVVLAPNGMPRSIVPPKGPVILGPTGMPRYLTAPQPPLPPPQPVQVLQQQEQFNPGPTYNESHDQSNSQSFDFMVDRISEPQVAE